MTSLHNITRFCARCRCDRICFRLCSQSTSAAGEGNLYDGRKYGHELPGNSVQLPFEPLPGVPTGVFRCTSGEILGPCSGKCSHYKNPEYFSYHQMSYFDFQVALGQWRLPTPKTGRKPT